MFPLWLWPHSQSTPGQASSALVSRANCWSRLKEFTRKWLLLLFFRTLSTPFGSGRFLSNLAEHWIWLVKWITHLCTYLCVHQTLSFTWPCLYLIQSNQYFRMLGMWHFGDILILPLTPFHCFLLLSTFRVVKRAFDEVKLGQEEILCLWVYMAVSFLNQGCRQGNTDHLHAERHLQRALKSLSLKK